MRNYETGNAVSIREYYGRGFGKWILISFGILMVLYTESLTHVDYKPRQTVIVGKLKDTKLFQPLKLTMDILCPYGNTLKLFLDYYGLAYTVIEEIPSLRCMSYGALGLMDRGSKRIEIQEHEGTKFTQKSPNKFDVEANKLPTIQFGSSILLSDGGFVLSVLMSYFLGAGQDSMWDIIDMYPFITYDDAIVREPRHGALDDARRLVINCRKYDLMAPDCGAAESARECSSWRQWADTDLVHHLCMCAHDSLAQSLTTCLRWAEEGQIRHAYSHIGRHSFMWLDLLYMSCFWYRRSNRLKAHYGIEGSVEAAVEEQLSKWVDYVESRGDNINHISQLTVFGILNTFEKYDNVFNVIKSNRKLFTWYEKTQKLVSNSEGMGTIDFEKLSSTWLNQSDVKNVKDYTSRKEVEVMRRRVEDEEIYRTKLSTPSSGDMGMSHTGL